MIDVKLDVAAGATLAWLPQETILFDRARLTRSIEVDLAPDARLFLAEAIVFGRSGMGEAVEEGALFDRWRVRRGGKLIYAEGVRLDGPIAQRLAETAVAKGGIAVATVLIVPGQRRNGCRPCAPCRTSSSARSAHRPGTASRPSACALPTGLRYATTSCML